MKHNLAREVGKLFTSGLVLILVGFTTWLAINSLPTPLTNNSTYPEPEVRATSSPLQLSEIALCDQWFSYRKAFTDEQRQWLEEMYQNCVKTRLTPSPVGISKQLQGNLSEGGITSPLFRKQAGAGTIIEASIAPWPSSFKVVNQWEAKIEGRLIRVYAGGSRSSSARAEEYFNDLTWQGRISVVVTSEDRNSNFPDDSGVYFMPDDVGIVRIIDSTGTTLILAAKDGKTFQFDVITREFLSTETLDPFIRTAGAGQLIESGITQYQIDGFDFVNQWVYPDYDLGPMVLLAGNEQDGLRRGVLILLVSSRTDDLDIIEEIIYLTDIERTALRIADANDRTLTIVSESGLIFAFDASLRQFVTFPAGIGPILTMPIIQTSSDSGQGILVASPTMPRPTFPPKYTHTPTQTSLWTPTKTPTRTPTRTPTLTPTRTSTPTPRPTRTALPTYDPYP